MKITMSGKVSPYPLGASYENGCIKFSYISSSDDCGILLFDRKTSTLLDKIHFADGQKIGNIYTCCYACEKPDEIAYQFYEGDRIVPDRYGKAFCSQKAYGESFQRREIKAYLPEGSFCWEEDQNPHIPYEDCLCYCLHVRGFTMHTSSKVKKKGTFLGVIEKIPYLKEIGVTTLEFQPIYEFIENEEIHPAQPFGQMAEPRLNYWGYKEGFYFAPKQAYSSGKDPAAECRKMIQALHKNRMEAVMQVYFPDDYSCGQILEILHFWVLEYHIDGFHLMGANLPVSDIAMDPLLADTKLWYYGFDTAKIYGKDKEVAQKNLAAYEDSYLYDVRKYLKGDEDMLPAVMYQMRYLPRQTGKINYLSNYYGFTLWDSVCYERKHNEANGEENRDGSDYNVTWNCGEEGVSRKKRIQQLRRQQYKNAVSLLMLSAGTPLIFMGDEFCNTQSGNNNPYCQDNEISWLNWKHLEKNQEQFRFFCQMSAFRRAHPVLRPAMEKKILDYLSKGYPDLSYHGINAWKPQMESYSRQLGIMFCGLYAQKEDGKEDDFLYIGLNMHWEPHKLALPRLPMGARWELLQKTTPLDCEIDDTSVLLPARTIVLFSASVCEDDRPQRRGAKDKNRQKIVDDRQPF